MGKHIAHIQIYFPETKQTALKTHQVNENARVTFALITSTIQETRTVYKSRKLNDLQFCSHFFKRSANQKNNPTIERSFIQ